MRQMIVSISRLVTMNNNNNNNSNNLYSYTLSREETLFKGVYKIQNLLGEIVVKIAGHTN